MNEVTEIPAATNPFGSPAPAAAGKHGSLTSVLEQSAIAEIQGRLIMAQKFPRDERECMDRIMNAFTRPSLAEHAKYQYSRGGSDIDGPSIRAAESMAQNWQNIEFGFRELSRHIGSDGVSFSQVEAYCFDLQNRTRRALQFNVRHWRDTRSGGYSIKDERDVYEMMANYAQRRVRACILAIIPGDVVDAAMNQAEITLRAKADTSPEAMTKMLEAFQTFGVTKEHVEKRIQRRMDAIQPAQVVSLKKIYRSLRDEMSAPHDWFDIEPPKPAMPAAVDAINQKLTSKSKEEPGSALKTEADPAKADPAKAAEEIPVMTYAAVLEKLQNAATKAELNTAAELISAVEDEGQRKELTEKFAEMRKGMSK